MPGSSHERITALLAEVDGATDAAVPLDRLLPLVYDELRNMAGRRLRVEHGPVTLSPTELVHEAYMRLSDGTRVTARGKAYFFAAAARAMRRIIVDRARRRGRVKRGRGEKPVTLSEALGLSSAGEVDVLDLEGGLERLAALAARPAQVVECRFYGGLSIEETALSLGVTTRTVNRDWQFARAWLFDWLTGGAPEAGS